MALAHKSTTAQKHKHPSAQKHSAQTHDKHMSYFFRHPNIVSRQTMYLLFRHLIINTKNKRHRHKQKVQVQAHSITSTNTEHKNTNINTQTQGEHKFFPPPQQGKHKCTNTSQAQVFFATPTL